jgi:hypothetical protein
MFNNFVELKIENLWQRLKPLRYPDLKSKKWDTSSPLVVAYLPNDHFKIAPADNDYDDDVGAIL